MEDRMTAQKLKNSILQMAVQGKLVPQDPNDEPASVLLERIRKEKEQLIKEGKIKRNKNESLIFRGADNLHYEQIGKEVRCIEDELPFEIPENWCWTKISNFCSILGGKRIPAGKKLTSENTGHIYIRVSDMKNGTVKKDNLKFVPSDIYPTIKKYIINKEDVFITVAGTIGKVGKIPFELDGANLTENADRLVFSKINQDWLIYVLSSPFIQSQIAASTTKVGQPKLAITRIEQILIPLPSIYEQKRIVNKIKELEPLIDKYRDAEEKLYELNSNIKEQLKKSILQYAIEGKLIPQDPNDEPASLLLDRIYKEKQKLITEGKIKKDKNESIIYRRDNSYYEKLDKTETCIDSNLPFQIPDNWCWERLNSFCNIIMGSSPEGNNISNNDKKGYEFHQGKTYYSSKYLLKSNTYTSQPTKICSSNSVLLCVRAPVGRVNIVDRSICIGRGLASIKPYGEFYIELLYYFLTTYEQYFIEHSTGSTFKAISSDVVKDCLLPIPPKNEQYRILESINKIFSLLSEKNK